jgi:hypothetical protein
VLVIGIVGGGESRRRAALMATPDPTPIVTCRTTELAVSVETEERHQYGATLVFGVRLRIKNFTDRPVTLGRVFKWMAIEPWALRFPPSPERFDYERECPRPCHVVWSHETIFGWSWADFDT